MGTDTTSTPPYITPGDRCDLQVKRRGWIEATVVSVRPMRTGRVEVKLVAEGGGDYTLNTDPKYGGNAIRYLGPGGPGVEGVFQGHQERDDHRASLKSDRAAVGVSALEKLALNPGDQVRVEYLGGVRRVETVVGVNYKTGKVGIEKETRTTPAERDRLEVAFYHMNQVAGTNVKPPRERDTRWIPANQVVGVVSRA